LSYNKEALHHFQHFKEVFLLGQVAKKAKAKPNPVRTELMKNGKVNKETNAETWTPSKKRRKMNASQD
jgi:hypothetical protein